MRRGGSVLILFRCLQSSRLLHETVVSNHRQLHLAGDHRASRAAGRIAAEKISAPFSPAAGSPNTRGRNDEYEERSTVAGPSSPQAYLYRLRHGRFDDLSALLSTPYAAPPLRILTDVLREVVRLRQQLTPKERGGEESTTSSTDNDNDSQRKQMWETLERMIKTLSDPLAVYDVLSKAIHILKEKTEAATNVGDEMSERELQKELRELESFVLQLRQWNSMMKMHGSETVKDALDVKFGHLLDWNIPNVVMANIWHAILELCSLTGAFDISVESLNELIELSERVERIDAKKMKNDMNGSEEPEEEGGPSDFTLDSVVKVVEDEVSFLFAPVMAIDHIRALKSCEPTRNFDIAHSLFLRYMRHAQGGVFPLTSSDISAGLISLAHCCNNTAHFAILQQLFVESEADKVVSVSVELYTALIDAVSRANENPQCLTIALALYRRLLDGGLSPTADTYAALIACCATTKEPTQAFAFYHEARHRCGVDELPSLVYTNLLLSYARAGYATDARNTLDVLVEAGAPLTRGAFHAVLSGALTLREAEEVISLMKTSYNISPTPQTYSYLISIASAHPNGVSTVLQMFDWHELTLKSLLDDGDGISSGSDTATHPTPRLLLDEHFASREALSSSHFATSLEKDLLVRYPAYAAAVEKTLIRLRLDTADDPRLKPYIQPLMRVAQIRMNEFTGMAPQIPTRIPKGAAIAVLAADVVANLEEYFMPFVSYYSAVVIPYSSLIALRSGSGRRVSRSLEKGTQELLNDPLWREVGSEQQLALESWRRVLVKFLEKYRDVIHLVSVEEELSLSRDCERYGIGVKKTFARSAALALNFSRLDVVNGTKLYAEQNCSIVLVSSNFDTCGRYVVDLKREMMRGGKMNDGLSDGLQRVWYHNPRIAPHWRPPQVSVASLVSPSNELNKM